MATASVASAAATASAAAGGSSAAAAAAAVVSTSPPAATPTIVKQGWLQKRGEFATPTSNLHASMHSRDAHVGERVPKCPSISSVFS